LVIMPEASVQNRMSSNIEKAENVEREPARTGPGPGWLQPRHRDLGKFPKKGPSTRQDVERKFRSHSKRKV